MSTLDNLKKRVQYQGGVQEGRMQQDKLKTLKKALLYSYQAATVELENEREFKCLINPDKNKISYENKIISIPFQEECLTHDNQVENTNLHVGDVFTWKETNTDWLIYLQFLEEDAYFRAEIRRCNQEITINDTEYKVHVRGPKAHTLLWHSRRTFGSWNDMNYDLEMYITKNAETAEFLHRFTKVKIGNQNWEVVAVDSYSSSGVLIVSLIETFTNSIEEQQKEVIPATPIIKPKDIYIKGESFVYPYNTYFYEILNNSANGIWEVNNSKVKILQQDASKVNIEIVTGRSGNFTLKYLIDGKSAIERTIDIKSL